MQSRSYTVGHLVQSTIGDPLVAEDNGYIVRSLPDLLFEQRDNSLRIVVIHLGLIETVQHRYLLAIEHGYGRYRRQRIRAERFHGIADGLCQVTDQSLAILPVVILHSNAGDTVNRHDIKRYLEFRHIQFHCLVGEHFLPEHPVITQHAHLIGEHNIRFQVIVSRYACKRVILVHQGRVKRIGILA